MAKVTGKITYISQTQEVQTRNGNFNKRELWIAPMYFDRYTGEPTAVPNEQSISIEFGFDRCAMLDTFKLDDTVVVEYELRGRTFEKDGRSYCITSLDGRRVSAFRAPQTTQGETLERVAATESPAPNAPTQNELPF